MAITITVAERYGGLSVVWQFPDSPYVEVNRIGTFWVEWLSDGSGRLHPCNTALDALADWARRHGIAQPIAGLAISADSARPIHTARADAMAQMTADFWAGRLRITADFYASEPHWVMAMDHADVQRRYGLEDGIAAIVRLWHIIGQEIQNHDPLMVESNRSYYNLYVGRGRDLPPKGEDITDNVLAYLRDCVAAAKAEALHREARRQAIISQARATGRPQELDRYMTSVCHSNEPDCSFDCCVVLVDGDGHISREYTHCY